MSSLVNKSFNWISITTAIIVSLIVIFSFFTKPAPPNIDVKFALSNSHKVSIAPTISAVNPEITDPFPLGIQVTNYGEEEVKNVHISIVSARNLALFASDIKIEPKLIFVKNGSDRTSHDIKIKSINPGQTVHFDNSIFAITENVMKMDIDVVTKDGVKMTLPISMSLTFQIQAIVSGANMLQKEIPLELLIGSEENLLKDNVQYFQYTDGEITRYN